MSWNAVELGNLCEVLDSKRKPITKRDRTEGDFPYYGSTGIVDFVGDYIFEEKLVLIGEDGAKWERGEKTAFIADGKYWVNNHAHVIKPNRDLLLDEWLVYYLYYKDLNEFVTGLTVPKLNQGQLRTIPIPLPSLATQQKIVAKLDAILADIDKARLASEVNSKNAEALYQSYLTEVFEKNEDSKRYKLDNVVTRLTNGYVGATKNIYLESGIPYLLARHVKNNVLKFDERTYISEQFNNKNKKSILKKDDVLLVQSGHIGHSAVVPEEHEGHNCHAMIVISTIKDILSGEFLSLYFQSNKMKILFESMKTGSTIKHLNCGDVKLLMIPIPSIEKQNKIIAEAKKIEMLANSIKNNMTDKLVQLNFLRDSILRQAFNGELVKE